MKQKLFYKDAYIKTFTTVIKERGYDRELGMDYVTLSETAFYPQGGGQPYDKGTLNKINVTQVIEDQGEIRHYLATPLDQDCTQVEGVIDWNRRLDHMQQHAGQHILSAAFEDLFDIKTIGFHLGTDVVTIDLDTEDLAESTVNKAEEKANQIVFDNRPIQIKWVNQSEVNQYPLRKQLSVTDNIRLVIIEGYDYSGCGGTHPKSTAEVGMIKVLEWERLRHHIRLSFICGRRILKNMDEKIKAIDLTNKLLHSSEQQLPQHVERLLVKNQILEKQLLEKQTELLQFEAKILVNNSTDFHKYALVNKAYHGRSIKEIQSMTQEMMSLNEDLVILLTTEYEDKIQFICARGNRPTYSMKALAQQVLPKINGNGGGSPQRAQGGGPLMMTSEKLLDELIQSLELL